MGVLRPLGFLQQSGLGVSIRVQRRGRGVKGQLKGAGREADGGRGSAVWPVQGGAGLLGVPAGALGARPWYTTTRLSLCFVICMGGWALGERCAVEEAGGDAGSNLCLSPSHERTSPLATARAWATSTRSSAEASSARAWLAGAPWPRSWQGASILSFLCAATCRRCVVGKAPPRQSQVTDL